MGLLTRLEERTYQSVGHPRDPVIAEWFGTGSRSGSGANVTADTAFGLTGVYRAVRLIANTIATLPLGVFERKSDGSRELALKHPLSPIIRKRPNRWQTAFGFKQMLAGHFELRGKAYAEIFADGRGRVAELIPLHPDRVTPRSGVLDADIGETIWYEYQPKNRPMRIILWDEMMHWVGFTQDGLNGLSPITVAREALGLAITNREYAARYLNNNSTPGGALKHPKTLTTEAKKNLRESWQAKHGGGVNAGKVAIFEEGMEWQSIGFNPKDSQFIEQRQFDVEEIARMFDIPPHKLMDLDRSTNNNIEHQGIEFVTDCILPRAVNLEETLERDLLLPSDEDRFFIEANLEGQLRADRAARGTFYSVMFSLGAYSPNDIRRKENENPVQGGDEYFVPLNMVPLKHAAELTEPPDPNKEPGDTPSGQRARAIRKRIVRAHERLFVDALGRALRKEVQAGRRALERNTVATWIDEFYPEHEPFVVRALDPVMHTAGVAIATAATLEVRLDESDLDARLEELVRNAVHVAARSQIAASRTELRRILRDYAGEEQRAQFNAAFTDWEERRAIREGPKEAADIAAIVAAFVYRMAGVPPIDQPILRGSTDET
jgi:HK97 family phage portal protein